MPHPLALSGRSSADKREDLGGLLAKAGAAAAVLTLPDSIAWLLNVRGGDVAHSPLPLSFAVLHADGGVEWFVDPDKLTDEVVAELGNAVAVEPPQRLGDSRPRRPAGFSNACATPAPRCWRAPILACCPRPARTPPSWTACAVRTGVTGRR